MFLKKTFLLYIIYVKELPMKVSAYLTKNNSEIILFDDRKSRECDLMYMNFMSIFILRELAGPIFTEIFKVLTLDCRVCSDF